METKMSDKSDEILKSLGKLSPSEMRQVIENLASQSPNVETWPTPALDDLKAKLAHLPNRLSAEDIIDRASLEGASFFWHVEDNFFECFVDSRDAQTEEEALKFAYSTESNQPWYPKSFANKSMLGLIKKVSSKEFREWIRRDRKEST